MTRRLPIQAVLLAGATAVGQLLMVFVLASVGRQVGPAQLGVVAVSMGIATVGAGFVDFGANSYWLRELSAGRLANLEFRRRSGTKIMVGSLLSIAILTVCLVFPTSISGYWGTGVILVSMVLLQTLQVAVRAEGRNIRLATITILDRAVLFIAYFLSTIFMNVRPETGFFLAYIGGSFVAAMLCWSTVKPELRPMFLKPTWLSTWHGSRYYGVSGLLITMQSLDVVIAASVGGQAVAGAYGAVSRWTQPIGLASNAFTSLLAPVVAKAESAVGVWHSIRGTLWLPAVSALVAIVMAIMAEPLILFLMGEDFRNSISVLRVLCAAAALSSASQVVFTVLQGRGRERHAAAIMVGGVGVQLALVGPLVHWYGAFGVAVASLVVQCLLLVLFLMAVRSDAFTLFRVGRAEIEPRLRRT